MSTIAQAPAPVRVSRTQSATVPTPQVWDDGKHLFVTHGAQLPHRCVKCNQREGVLMVQQRFTWSPRWTLLIPLLPLLLRRKVTVRYGICQDHLNKRRSAIATFLTVLVMGSGLALMGHLRDVMPIELAGAVSVAMALAGLVLSYPVLRVRRIHRGVATLKGADLDFICSLYRQRRFDPAALAATPRDAELAES